MLISGHYTYSYHVCIWRGDKHRTQQYPINTEIIPRSRFRRENRGCQNAISISLPYFFRGPDEGVPLPDGSKVPDAEVPHQGVLGL